MAPVVRSALIADFVRATIRRCYSKHKRSNMKADTVNAGVAKFPDCPEINDANTAADPSHL